MGRDRNEKRFVHVERRGPVGIVALDRPERANAYHASMLAHLSACVREVVSEPALRVLVIRSTGKHFCAGADLEEIAQRRHQDAFDLKSLEVFEALATSRKVTLASISGGAVGGGFELALACDLRVATADAFFEMPEVAHGIIPAAGGTRRLARMVGPSRAKAVILGGRRMDAREALECGLVADLVDPDELEEKTIAWAQRIAHNDGLALHLAKEAIDVACGDRGAQHVATLSQALLYELALQRTLG